MVPGICSIKARYFKKFITTNNGNDCGQTLGGTDIFGGVGGEKSEKKVGRNNGRSMDNDFVT